MLTTLATMFGGQIIDGLLSKGLDAFKSYNEKKISLEELRTQLMQALLATFGEIEKAHAQAIEKSFGALMGAAKDNPVVARAWSFVVYSQTAVLVYHQVGIPAIVILVRWLIQPGWNYPSSGSTVEWAYLLLGICLGAGVMGLRAGPGAGDVAGKLKSMVGK